MYIRGQTMKFRIREERIEDRAEVERVVELAFADVRDSDHTEHLLVRRLRDCAAFVPELSLVAEDEEGGIVGHILLTKVEIVPDDAPATVQSDDQSSCGRADSTPAVSLALAPLSVLPEFQLQGIGSALIVQAHRHAVALGFGSAVVLGHKDYYPRFGYRPASQFGINLPFDAPAECCMAIELIPGSLSGIHGTVRYSPPFCPANKSGRE